MSESPEVMKDLEDLLQNLPKMVETTEGNVITVPILGMILMKTLKEDQEKFVRVKSLMERLRDTLKKGVEIIDVDLKRNK